MPKLQKGKAHVPTQEEMKRLFKIVASTKNAKRDKLLVLFSYGLGLRAIEMAGLKLSQVFNTDGSINEVVSLTKTKGNKPRTLYLMDKRIQESLKDYFNFRKNKDDPNNLGFSLDVPLFLTQHGTSFCNRTMQKRFEQIYKMAGIRGASSHSGRRTFATKLIEQGVDIKAVSTLMGHASIAITAEYVEDNPDRLKKIVLGALTFI